MSRAIFSLTAVGAGLVAGGVGYAAVMGYDVTRLDIWFKGVRVVAQTPGVAIEFATNGGMESPFYQALLMGTTGLTCLFGAAALGAGKLVWGGSAKEGARGEAGDTVRHKLKGKIAEASHAKDAFSDEDDAPKAAGASPLSTMKKIAAALDKKKARDEFDASFDAEDKAEAKASKGDGLGVALMSMLGKKDGGKDKTDDVGKWDAPLEDEGISPAREQGNPTPSPARIRKATARVRVAEDDGWHDKIGRAQDVLMAFWDRALSFLEKRRGDAAERPEDEGAVGKSMAFAGLAKMDAEILEWFRSVQQSTGNTHDKVTAAARYAKLLTEEERVAFVERNSIDGAFIIRLIDSWSTRTDRDTAPANDGEANDERAALRAAIRAVHMEKAGRFTIDETVLPAEFRADMETEEARLEEEDEVGFVDDTRPMQAPYTTENDPAGFAGTPTQRAPAPAPETSEDDEEKAWTSAEKELVALAQKMRDFVITLREVQAFEAAWEDDLEDADTRQEYINEIESRFAQITFMMIDKDIEKLMEREGAEALHWALSMTDIGEKGFVAYVESLMAEDGAQGPEGEEGQEEGATGATDTGGWSDDDIADTPAPHTYEEDVDLGDEEQSVPIAPDADATHEAPVQAGAEDTEPRHTQDEDTVRSSSSEDTQDGGKDWEDGDSAPPPKNRAEGAETDTEVDSANEQTSPSREEEGDEEGTKEALGSEPSVAHEQGAETDAVQGYQVDMPPPQEEAPTVPPHVPSDIGWADMQEIAAASEFIKQWGVSSKRAGATNGAMMKFTSRRDGDSLVPLGLIHLVMLWKDRAGAGRVNLMFRHLGEGVWRMDETQVGLFVRDNGDRVEVAPSLFESDDFQKALLVIHVHGPGVEHLEGPVPEAWGSKTWVVDEVASGEDILARLDAVTP